MKPSRKFSPVGNISRGGGRTSWLLLLFKLCLQQLVTTCVLWRRFQRCCNSFVKLLEIRRHFDPHNLCPFLRNAQKSVCLSSHAGLLHRSDHSCLNNYVTCSWSYAYGRLILSNNNNSLIIIGLNNADAILRSFSSAKADTKIKRV